MTNSRSLEWWWDCWEPSLDPIELALGDSSYKSEEKRQTQFVKAEDFEKLQNHADMLADRLIVMMNVSANGTYTLKGVDWADKEEKRTWEVIEDYRKFITE